MRPANMLVEGVLGASSRQARMMAGSSTSALRRGATINRSVSTTSTSASDRLCGLRMGASTVRRQLSTSISRHAIFGSSSSTAPAQAVQPVPSSDHDAPLTPFQTQIAGLETEALSDPEDLEKQLKLMRALLEGGEFVGISKYYETMALTSEEHGSKALLESGEALDIYLEALGKVGRMREVAGVVRRRDTLRNTASTASVPTTPSASSSAASSSTTSTSTSGSPSILSGLISPSASPSSGSSASASQALPTQPGTPLAPIYVQMAPATPQMSAMRAIRWLLGMMFWAFIVLTILSMVMENTGLLKAGPGPAEFEPEEGKVVKFSDVHGVEEAKNVSRLGEG